jgi:hypothetical protein
VGGVIFEEGPYFLAYRKKGFNKVARYSFLKWKIHGSTVFLENYYLLKNKKYLFDVKQHIKGLNIFT